MTNEQLQKLYESQQLGEATATNPTQLPRTALFYVTLSTSANVAEKVNENLKNSAGKTILRAPCSAVHEKPSRWVP